MNPTDTIRDLVDRVCFSLDNLPEVDLTTHPGGHPNSVGWLLWHTGREIDMQLAHVAGTEEVWTAEGFRTRFDLGELGDTLGYGHTPEEAASLLIDDRVLLEDYIRAGLVSVEKHAATVDDWDEVVDHYHGAPVTRQVRVTSLLIDALEHLAQAAYVAGMP